MMDERPDSRGTPGTPPSAPAPSASPAPSPKEQAPPTPPLMLATMTPVNVDGYLYEHPQHSESQAVHHHHHHQPVIYSTASGLADHHVSHVSHGIPVSEDALMDGTVSVVYQQQVPSNTVVIMSELVDDMSPVLQLR